MVNVMGTCFRIRLRPVDDQNIIFWFQGKILNDSKVTTRNPIILEVQRSICLEGQGHQFSHLSEAFKETVHV